MNKHVGCVLARTKLSAVGCALARTNSIDAACVRRPRLLVGLAALDPPYGHGACEHAPYSAARTRGGFTLVELLIVVVIIGLLGTMMIVALRGAAETAREAATKATIAKLHGIIMDRYSGYLTRRVQVNTGGLSPKNAAQVRLTAIRYLMQKEMPDRVSDVQGNPATDIDVGHSKTMPWPSFARLMNTRVAANSPAPSQVPAEMLYAIVASNPEDMEQFGQSEIADTDSDGWPEFLDAWGRPIQFLRFAPGFTPYSDIQDTTVHDPFDPRRLRANDYSLVPLIFSAGPDGIYGIATELEDTDPNYPYVFNGNPFSTDGSLLGAPTTTNGAHNDNITNHYLEVR
ncbi:MAG: type II secretion system protein [Planctomycetota bacterium]